MNNFKLFIIITVLIFVPLYPKFPLLGISGSFVSVRLEDFLLAFVFLFWLINSLIKKYASLKLPLQRSIILYLFIGLVSSIGGLLLTKSVEPNLVLLHTLRRFEYMGMFFVAYDFLTSKKQLLTITRVIILVSFIVGLYGLGQQYLGLPIISTNNSEFSKGLALTLGENARINSTFAGHYDLAAFSLIPLLLIVGLLASNARNKGILIIMMIPIYYAMLLSASRVTFVAFFLICGLFLIFLRKKLWLIPMTVIMIISIFISPQLVGRYRELLLNHFLTLTPSVYAQTTTPISTPLPLDQEIPDALKPPEVVEDRSFNIRLQASWPRAVRAFQKNPLIGTGFSSIGLAADNDYLRMIAETGILGLLAFALICIRIFKTSLPLLFAKNLEFDRIFILSTTFAFMGLLISAVFIDIFEASKIAIIIWTLLGLSQKAKTLS